MTRWSRGDAWKALGLPRPQAHVCDLRHSEGIDAKTVSSIMGHVNASMMLNIYANADTDARRVAAMTIDEVMCGRIVPQELKSFA